MHTTDILNGQHNLFEVGDQDFEAKVLKSTLPVIVNFGAQWCPPCHALTPVYQKLSRDYEGRLGFARLDIDENSRVSTYYRVQAAPTVILFKDGKELERIVGPHPGRLNRFIERVLAENGCA